MLRLLGIVISIGLADSMNPSTIAPALYLAAGEEAPANLTKFTVGVFAVYFVGGGIIMFGPGQLLLSLVPHPGPTARYVLELIAGVVILIGGVLVWGGRRRLGRHELPAPRGSGRSSLWLGVTVMAVELPTAFPYFAAVAAVVGSGVGVLRQLLLLVLYNVCFVAPLLAIIVTVVAAGDKAVQVLDRARIQLQKHWPALLASVALVAGLFVTALGATGLAMRGHGAVAHGARRLRRVIAR